MAKKPTARAEVLLFDVIYEDGSQRSNRRVSADLASGYDSEAQIKAAIEEQDRDIAAKSGLPPLAIKTIKRSGK